MNGSTLTLSLVGALALGAAVGRRGSRSGRWVYHLTYRSDLPSIARQGLTPRSDTQEAWDNEPGVYFVNTFGYEAGAPESEEPAWLRLPAPHALPASFWTSSLQEGHTLISFPPDAIEVWVDAEGRPAAKADGVAWKPLREVVHVKRGTRTTDPTSTPAFRRWFGESKVVDGAGRPLVVYHGARSSKTFEVFRGSRRGWYGSGMYFTPDRDFAEGYAKDFDGNVGHLVSVYLRMERPYRYESRNFENKEFVRSLLSPRSSAAVLSRSDRESVGPGDSIRKALVARGYDGIIANNPDGTEYIVFESTQIKSATGNRGTFDPADPRISFNRSAR